MKALYRISITEFKLAFRNFTYIFFVFVFPIMMLLIFGGMYGNEPSEFYGGHGAVDMLTPALMATVLAVSGIMSLPIQLSEYRQNKVLKRFKATPISKSSIMIPHILVNAILCILGIILLIIIGKLVFDLNFFGSVFYFTLSLLLSIACIFSMGFLIAAIAPNSRAANAIAYLVYFPMLFLSGATIPLQAMPDIMITISKFLPLTYVVELLQGSWVGDPMGDHLKAIIVLASVTVACILASLKVFRWE